MAATAPVPVPVEDQPAHGGDQPQVPGHVTDSGTAGLTSGLTSGLGRVKTVSIKNQKKYNKIKIWSMKHFVHSIINKYKRMKNGVLSFCTTLYDVSVKKNVMMITDQKPIFIMATLKTSYPLL